MIYQAEIFSESGITRVQFEAPNEEVIRKYIEKKGCGKYAVVIKEWYRIELNERGERIIRDKGRGYRLPVNCDDFPFGNSCFGNNKK